MKLGLKTRQEAIANPEQLHNQKKTLLAFPMRRGHADLDCVGECLTPEFLPQATTAFKEIQEILSNSPTEANFWRNNCYLFKIKIMRE